MDETPMEMNNYLCLFPFVRVSDLVNVLGVRLKPGSDVFLSKEDRRTNEIINQMVSSGGGANITVDNYSYAIIPSKESYTLSCQTLTNESDTQVYETLKKTADFLRYRISYQKHDFDYDQCLFLLVHSVAEGSTKVSVDGGPITLLDSKFFQEKCSPRKTVSLTISPEDLPPYGLQGPLSQVFRLPKPERFWRALDWFGKSFVKDNGLDDRYQIICVAIAFEALLDLPETGIAHSFRSYVTNLIGDNPDLHKWAGDFYELRSAIVHGNVVDETKVEPLSKKNRHVPAIFYTPRYAKRKFVNTLHIAREVFRDLVGALALTQKGRKADKYSEFFFTDEKIISEIEGCLKGMAKVGFQSEDDNMDIEYRVQDLRRDGTATVPHMLEVSKLLIGALQVTFSVNSPLVQIWELGRKLSIINKNDVPEILRTVELLRESLENLLKDEGNLPYKEVQKLSIETGQYYDSNLSIDILRTCRQWFGFVHNSLYYA